MNYLYSELKAFFDLDIMRFRTKFFVFCFNILPDLYCLRVLKNCFLVLAGMKCSPLFSYIKNGLYCDMGHTILIGKGCFINYGIYFEGTGQVTIGSACQIGPHVSFLTTDHKDRSCDTAQNIQIGNNVWIGANVVFLPGAIVGDNINIAAGSVVRGTLLDGVLWAGNPAIKKK